MLKALFTSIFALLVLAVLPATAQVVRLPSVIDEELPRQHPWAAAADWPASDSGAPGSVPMYSTGPARTLPASYSDDVTQPMVPDTGPTAAPAKPAGAKSGVLQQIAVTETWIPRGDTGLGFNDLATQAVFGFPFFTREAPLVLTPAYEIHYVDGPTVPDLPPRLHDASFQIRHMRKVSPLWGIDLAITPGWHGDFEADSGKTFRLPARVVTAYDWSPTTQLILGIAYLDREDVDFLPVGGIILSPDDATRVEAIFPRPRIARRFGFDGSIEDWVYLAGEFGGGSYGIERASGGPDVATLSDLRLITGIERKSPLLNARFEFGYVFAREIEYLSGTPTFEPDDTVMVRGGLWY